MNKVLILLFWGCFISAMEKNKELDPGWTNQIKEVSVGNPHWSQITPAMEQKLNAELNEEKMQDKARGYFAACATAIRNTRDK